MCILCSGCKKESQSPVSQPKNVQTAKTTQMNLPTYITLPGITSSVHSTDIHARVEGWILERHFEEGQVVQLGDLLYVLDSAPYEAALLQAKAALSTSVVQAKLAQDVLLRNTPLAERGAISEEEFDKILTQSVSANLDIELRQAQVDAAQLNVGYCNIYAQQSGRIGKTNADAGELVGPGNTSKLTEIVQMSPMYVEFYPPASRLSIVRKYFDEGNNQPLVITQTQDASEGQPSNNDSIVNKTTITGTLVFVDNTVQTTTSTFLARGEFINNSQLLPGQYVEVRLQLEIIADAVMVPTDAISQQPGGYYVWTVTKDKTSQMVPVTLGAILGKSQHVLTGLAVGDEVVVKGTTSLRGGKQVHVTNEEK